MRWLVRLVTRPGDVVLDPFGGSGTTAKHGAGVLEIKNVDWLQFKKWQAGDGTIEAPAHIEIQVQHQLACIARSWAAIGVLVGGNTLELLVRERDYAVCKALRAKCEKFWSDMDRGVMPPIELPADAAIVAQMYRYAEPGKVLDAQGNAKLDTKKLREIDRKRHV